MKTEWISVKYKLPTPDTRVLIFLSTGIIKVDERFKSMYGVQVGDLEIYIPR